MRGSEPLDLSTTQQVNIALPPTLFFHFHKRLGDAHHLDQLVSQFDAVLSVSEAKANLYIKNMFLSVKIFFIWEETST